MRDIVHEVHDCTVHGDATQNDATVQFVDNRFFFLRRSLSMFLRSGVLESSDPPYHTTYSNLLNVALLCILKL